ncbi:hypothetical protein F0562_032091 [Nyssa sinensis]|uniref:Uncharacterized protein n=1 Tax=Nyssa sinensis TaxID=561372 RepID=A0A5J5AWK5_9ASTE|nr:hypothetical protein F0562_032091 [Nyssa sinensis]
MYSAHLWADRAEEGEFIPQVALELVVEFGAFSEHPSFLMESFHGDSSSPSIRGRRSFNNGSHGGRGGGRSGAQVARGIQAKKQSFNSFDKAAFPSLRSAYVSHSKGLLADSKGARDGKASQDMQKTDGAATYSSDLGGNGVIASGDQQLGNALTLGNEVRAVQDLKWSSSELSHTAMRGGNTLRIKRVHSMCNPLTYGGEVRAVQGSLTTQKVAFLDLMCGSNVLSHVAERGGNTIGVKGEQPLGTRLNQEGGVNNLAASKSAFSDFKSGSKGLSPIIVGGSVGWFNTMDIGAESLANPLGKYWCQVVNSNV